MLKGILSLITLVGSISFASQLLPGSAKTYSITLNPHATSYQGEKFNRLFQLTTTFKVADKIIAQAKASDSVICDYDDNGQATNCQDVCVSSVEFTAGKLLTSAADLDNEYVITTEKEFKVSAHSQYMPGKCNGAVPQITSQAASIFGYNSTATEVAFAKDGQQSLSFVFDTFTADMKNLGNNVYEVSQINLQDKITGAVYYTHVSKDMLTWSVWNLVKEGQIQRADNQVDGF